jgi:hypothetical protein
LLYAFATAIFALDSNNEFPAAAPHRSQRSNNPQGFWLSTELRSSGFRKGCLSTALCHKAVFKIIHTMTLNGESTVLSWPLTQQVLLFALYSTVLVLYLLYFIILGTRKRKPFPGHSLDPWRPGRHLVELPSCWNGSHFRIH